MAFSHEFDPPNAAGGGEPPQMDPFVPGADPGATPSQDGIMPERLKQVVRRLETGFYDAPEVQERIARNVCKELDP